jgi:hypothetical protein
MHEAASPLPPLSDTSSVVFRSRIDSTASHQGGRRPVSGMVASPLQPTHVSRETDMAEDGSQSEHHAKCVRLLRAPRPGIAQPTYVREGRVYCLFVTGAGCRQ